MEDQSGTVKNYKKQPGTIITSNFKLQTDLVRDLDELERNQKEGKSSKYNFQDDGHIGSGPVVHI